jgi:hypothetical protein
LAAKQFSLSKYDKEVMFKRKNTDVTRIAFLCPFVSPACTRLEVKNVLKFSTRMLGKRGDIIWDVINLSKFSSVVWKFVRFDTGKRLNVLLCNFVIDHSINFDDNAMVLWGYFRGSVSFEEM